MTFDDLNIRLGDLIAEAQNAGLENDEIISAMELATMALEEAADEDDA